MCVECGCESVGSSTGIVPVTLNDQTKQCEAGVTLGMTSSFEGMREFGAGN